MTKFRFHQGNLLVRFFFTRPILDFQRLAPEFNEMIYSSLPPAFPVSPNDLSVNSSNRLSENWVKFNLYSGPNSVTLLTDRLAFEFVNLVVTDYPVVYDLLRRVHDAFPQHFPSLKCERFESQYLSHLDVTPEHADQFLARFSMRDDLTGFANLGSFIEEPCARSTVAATDQSWQSRLGIERSLAISNGIFIDLTTTLKRAAWDVPFVEKVMSGREIAYAWLKSLTLESSDVFI